MRNAGAGVSQILTNLEASGPGAVSANALGLSRGAAPSIAARAALGDVYSAAVGLPTDIAALAADARVAAAAGSGTLLGAGVLGAATNATGSVAFSYFGSSLDEGALWFGFTGLESDFAEPANFRSLSLTLELQGDALSFERQWQFTDVDSLAAFFSDQLLEIGAFTDPSLDVRLGFAFEMVGDAHWGFGYAFGIRTDGPIAAVSEPGSIGLMLAALALFGFTSATANPMRRSNAANLGSSRRLS